MMQERRMAARLALVLAFVAAARLSGETQSAVSSVYTELAGARCVSEQTAAGERAQRCRGIGGWSLLLVSGPQQVSLAVVPVEGDGHPLLRADGNNGLRLGPNAEWRVRDGASGVAPNAVIVRIDALEPRSNGKSARASYLAVAKVGDSGTCVVGKIALRGDAAAQARRLADAPERACIRPQD